LTDGLGDWGGAEFVLAADRLDTPDVVEAADPGDVLRQVASAAAQVRTALRSCQETDLSALTPDGRPRAILTAGLGTSGLAGEMLQAVIGFGSAVQVVTTPAGRLPGWAGAADLVIAVSCSGTSEETLAVAAEAARRGCRLAAVGATGSPLHRIAEQARAPFIPAVPAGLARSMLWSLAIPLLAVAERLGVARIGADVYELAASRLEEVSHQCRPASESFVNPGKSLALDLVGALPLVWGTSPLSGVAAHRFAAQLAENAKYPAITGALPEAACDQLAAFDGPFTPAGRPAGAGVAGAGARERLPEGAPDATTDDLPGLEDLSSWDLDYDETEDTPSGFSALRLVLIADPDEDPRTSAQREAITELAAQRGIGVSELAMDGEHPLVRLAGVVQLADYASVYLAIASGIDPGQAAAITDVQSRIE
jgi:glucose/mannose-6-phosphate isomerase